MENFPKELKAARAAAGLSQAKLAAVTTIPLRTLQDWEAGVRTPPPYVQHMVLDKLNSILQSQTIAQ